MTESHAREALDTIEDIESTVGTVDTYGFATPEGTALENLYATVEGYPMDDVQHDLRKVDKMLEGRNDTVDNMIRKLKKHIKNMPDDPAKRGV